MPRISCFVLAVLGFAGCAAHGNAAHSVAIGGSCDYDVDCATPTDANAIASCACGTCEEQDQLGLTCGDDGRVCNADETCAFSVDGSGGCMPSASEGASCEVVNCLPGLFCGSNTLCARAAAVGASCDPNDEDSCAAPSFCDGASHTCVPLGATGAACDWTRYERAECVAGDGCSIVSSTCVEELDDGETCTDDAGCLSGFCAPSGACETRSCNGGA